DEAIACCKKALDLDPTNAAGWSNLGIALHEQGKHAESEAASRKAIGLKPDLAAGHLYLALALTAQGKKDDSIVHFRQTIALDPNHAGAHVSYGALLCDHLRDYDGAIASFTRAIELKPDYPQAYRNRSVALSRKGLVDDAIADLRTALRLKPDYPEPYM